MDLAEDGVNNAETCMSNALVGFMNIHFDSMKMHGINFFLFF